uniref:Uncharacterized protein n=1 Tax=Ditylenchus dipsaci TaxID=166011 RepID=A0A915EAU4_9BILA
MNPFQAVIPLHFNERPSPAPNDPVPALDIGEEEGQQNPTSTASVRSINTSNSTGVVTGVAGGLIHSLLGNFFRASSSAAVNSNPKKFSGQNGTDRSNGGWFKLVFRERGDVTLTDDEYLELAERAAGEVRSLISDLSLWNLYSDKKGIQIYERDSNLAHAQESMLLLVTTLPCTVDKLESCSRLG